MHLSLEGVQVLVAEVRSPGRFHLQLAEGQERLKAMMDRSAGFRALSVLAMKPKKLPSDVQAGRCDGDLSGGAGGGAQGGDHLAT